MDISQQQDEPVLTIQRLENELSKYKSQTKKLKKHVSILENQINLKDQQLDEKSKCIINCISENLQLKQQIGTLKRQLNITQSLNKRRKAKTNKSSQSIELAPQQSFESNAYENVSVNSEMPYITPSVSNSFSISSNISEQACKISFPSPNKMPTDYSPLSPIAERDNNDDQYQNVFTPITVMSDNCSFKMMTQSNANSHIHQNEWNESIVTISTTPSPKSMPIVNAKCVVPDAQIFPSDEEENEFGSITTMTTASVISHNNDSLSGIYEQSMTIKSPGGNNNFTHFTILNILGEDKSDTCNQSYISIID